MVAVQSLNLSSAGANCRLAASENPSSEIACESQMQGWKEL